MKTYCLAAIPLVLTYVLFFILWEPLYLVLLNNRHTHSAFMLSQYDKYAHASWIELLGSHSKVKEWRLRNSLYWCERVKSCGGVSYEKGTIAHDLLAYHKGANGKVTVYIKN